MEGVGRAGGLRKNMIKYIEWKIIKIKIDDVLGSVPTTTLITMVS